MLNTSKVPYKTVLIANRIHSRENMTIYQRNLEFSSDTMYNSLVNALSDVSSGVTCYTSIAEFIDNLHKHKDDIVIATVWSGVDSRNRRVFLPAICEAYGLPYVGADAYAQAICADKVMSKVYCKQHGIDCANGITLTRKREFGLLNTLSFPVVLKPNFEGGSIGISDSNIADSIEDARVLAEKLLMEYETVLVEEYLEGSEVSACFVGSPDMIDLFEVVKISLDGVDYFEHRILGFESKKGKCAKQERSVITHQICEATKHSLQSAFSGLGKVDFMRIDGRIKDGKFYLLELTPDCSLHPECFMYKAFSHNGYRYSDMIAALLNQAIKSKHQ